MIDDVEKFIANSVHWNPKQGMDMMAEAGEGSDASCTGSDSKAPSFVFLSKVTGAERLAPGEARAPPPNQLAHQDTCNGGPASHDQVLRNFILRPEFLPATSIANSHHIVYSIECEGRPDQARPGRMFSSNFCSVGIGTN